MIEPKYITSKRGPFIIFIITFLSFFAASMTWNEKVEPEPYELKYPSYFGGRFNVPEDNPLTKQGVSLGRNLFYDPILSKNNKISCSSCHQQQLAFTDGKPFSVGIDGSMTKRSSMSLANLLWVRNFFWDGRVNSLEAQALIPLTDPHEMGQPMEEAVKKLKAHKTYPSMFNGAFGQTEITSDKILKALAQFERTLISSNSKYDQYLVGDYTPSAQELNGLKLFMTSPDPNNGIRGGNCGHCHGTPKIFKELFHNNGLDTYPKDSGRMEFTRNDIDLGRFRVPTLRNIALTAPYMHDGDLQTFRKFSTTIVITFSIARHLVPLSRRLVM